MLRQLNYVVILVLSVLACSSPSLGEEQTELTAAIELLSRRVVSEDAAMTLAKWQAAATYRSWKDASGQFEIFARMVDVADDSLTLERKDNGKIVVVQLKSLNFQAKERAAEARKVRVEIIELAAEIRRAIEIQSAERRAKAEADKKRAEFLASLTPAQRAVLELAKEKDQAGKDQVESFSSQLLVGTGTERLRFLVRIGSGVKLLNTLAEHYQRRTLSAEVVKEAVNASGGSEGAIACLEGLLFGEKTTDSAFIFVDPESSLIRLDIYLAAGRALRPEIRASYGFTQVEAFEKLGNRLYWQVRMDNADSPTP